MGAELPEVDLPGFAGQLRQALAGEVDAVVVQRLHAHYEELRRWNRRLSLVGPGTREEIVERHYAESLLALPLLPAAPARAVDLGSGAGFPGLVLATARPDIEFTLVESRQRKWAFLMAASHRVGLSCRCLNARVEHALSAELPATVDLVTVRALRLSAELLAPLMSRLAPRATLLLWLGRETPDLPGWRPGRTIPIPRSASRRILELIRDGAPANALERTT